MNVETNRLSVYITEESFELDYITDENLNEAENSLLSLYQKDKFEFLFELAFVKEQTLSISLTFLQYLARTFLQAIANDPKFNFSKAPFDCEINESAICSIIENAPYLIGLEFVNKEWVLNILAKFNTAYKNIVEKSQKTPMGYVLSRGNLFIIPSRIYFHLVENKDNDDFPFAFLATYTAIENEKLIHCPLKNALTQLKADKNKLSALVLSITEATKESALIKKFVENGNIFYPIKLSEYEAYTFLKEVPFYEQCGIVCRIPKWYTESISKIQVDIDERAQFTIHSADGDGLPVPEMIYKGVVITPEEARSLLEKAEGLEIIKGKWVENNHSEIKKLLSEFDLLSQEGTSLLEIFKMKSISFKEQKSNPIPIEISQKSWLTRLFQKDFNDSSNLLPTISFSNVLRPYQTNAFKWMYGMSKLKMGVCLADDMGLGKTIEVLSFLDKIKEEGKEKVLIIVPATLVENWKKEINKFAPHFSVFILKGENEPVDDRVKAYITITTYQTAIRLDYINRINWDLVVLDEAQAIKNYYTSQSKKVKSLNTKMRIAMTGTPIENNLLELWSLFDFVNPGLLGTRDEFKDFYFGSDKFLDMQKKLKSLISPFVLRRVKTDKTIISDLPEKHEIDVTIDLSKKQIVLYRKIVADLEEQKSKAESQRQLQALVLTTILKLKQVCNHPSQYLGDEKYDLEDSGKFIELKRICETIHAKREKVLVFTQFKEIIPAINELLSKVFNKIGYSIDGETSMQKRNAYIDSFQNGDTPYMVLSLKTAGVGLNLTAAQNVVHFDRWWNPAVENQATDRVYRIGQTKNVTVYRFTSANTVEENINKKMSIKQHLADEIINDIDSNVMSKLSIDELISAIQYGSYDNE